MSNPEHYRIVHRPYRPPAGTYARHNAARTLPAVVDLVKDDATGYAGCSRSRMQHVWRKQPRDEADSDAHEWPADKQPRLAGRPFRPAASPTVLAGHATPASLSKSRTTPAQSLLANVSPSPGFGGAFSALAFSFRPSVLRPPPAAAPASLSKGFSNYADGYYTMSAPPPPPLAPPRSGVAASSHRALLPLAQQPPPPPLQRGFAESKLLFGEGTTCRPNYAEFIELYQKCRPDAAPSAAATLSFPQPELAEAAPTAHAAALVSSKEKIAALQPNLLSLSRRLWRALEPTPREASRQREIEQVEAQMNRLAKMQLRQTAPASGLEPLSEEQLQLATDALGPGPQKEILAARAFKSFGELDVMRLHFGCMREGEWLNDEVINFYLGLLQERELRLNPKQPRVHFHNTFFYNKLFADSREYNYKSVARWTSLKKLGYCIMDCDLVCIPVHQEVHWVLAVIDIKQREVRYYDSLGGKDRSCMANLLRYAADEAKGKLDKTLDVSDWKQLAPEDIPEQKNGCDCGVFMVKFADWLARQADWSFSQKHMPYFRKRIIAEVRQQLAE